MCKPRSVDLMYMFVSGWTWSVCVYVVHSVLLTVPVHTRCVHTPSHATHRDTHLHTHTHTHTHTHSHTHTHTEREREREREREGGGGGRGGRGGERGSVEACLIVSQAASKSCIADLASPSGANSGEGLPAGLCAHMCNLFRAGHSSPGDRRDFQP